MKYPVGDYRRNDPGYQGDNYDANRKAAQTVGDIATANHVKPGQIVLARLMGKGSDIVPIPGTKCQKHLEENGAAGPIELDPAGWILLDDALAPETSRGSVMRTGYGDDRPLSDWLGWFEDADIIEFAATVKITWFCERMYVFVAFAATIFRSQRMVAHRCVTNGDRV